MHSEIIKTYEEFLKLENVWDELLIKSNQYHINLTFNWNKNWIQTYWKNQPLFIIVVYEANEIIGIAPLVIHNSYKILRDLVKVRRISFMASGINDSCDFIISQKNNNVIDLIIKTLFDYNKLWDELQFVKMFEYSVNYKPLIESLKKYKIYTNIITSYTSSFVNTQKTFDEYLKTLSKSTVKSINRKLKKIYPISPEFKIYKNLSPEIFNRILEIESARESKYIIRSSFFNNELNRIFFGKSINDYYRNTQPLILTIETNNKMISFMICFLENNTLKFWLASFDINFSQYSPGFILFYHTIKYCCENNIVLFDMMLGIEEYKKKWTMDTINVQSVFFEKAFIRIKIRNIYRIFGRIFHKYFF
ncbi:MAG: GNAT family N-acetyltransferase [Ignavibacteria bacterium]|nr:GNAT family N-acetyltransferase [Ignavibacteria bacterium]